MITDQWWSCYNDGLKGWISDASFSHPAKVSLSLARRIYRHALDECWLTPGSLCVDPMAGVATFGLVAATFGIPWVGIELEERFCSLGQGNIALHTREWLTLGKPLPLLLQGDARELQSIIEQAGLVCSSPPYSDSAANDAQRTFARTGILKGINEGDTYKPSAIVSSPPYADTAVAHVDGNVSGKPGGTLRNRDNPVSAARHGVGYSQPQAIVSSPPYADGCRGFGTDPHPERAKGMEHSEAARVSANAFRNGYSQPQAIISSPPYADQLNVGEYRDPLKTMAREERYLKAHPELTSKRPKQEIYGVSDGQLGAMREGSLAAVISSPPYVSGGHHADQTGAWNTNGRGYGKLTKEQANYGQSLGQIGNLTEPTYWSEMAKIYRQCWEILPAGGEPAPDVPGIDFCDGGG